MGRRWVQGEKGGGIDFFGARAVIRGMKKRSEKYGLLLSGEKVRSHGNT